MSILLAWAMATATLPGTVAMAADPIVPAEPGTRPTAGSDENELWYAMERIERDLQTSPVLLHDPALEAYVRGVACRVAGDFCSDLRIYIVDLPYFNASMAPNGMMIVWTGSLLRIHDEAELALVLGHEFGHYRERHSLQQWRKLKQSSAFLGTFGVLAGGAGLGVAGMAANLAGAASLMKFSRDKEREADAIGFSRVVAQGYDPNAGVALWERMLREENARDYGKPMPVFASHPQTRERRDDLRTAAAAISDPGRESGQDRYRAATRPFLKRWLENELTRRMYASSIQAIGDLRDGGMAEDAGLYSFFLAEAYRRRGLGEDRSKAAALYAESVGQAGAPPEAWREHGLALRETGRTVEAATALRRYLELSPVAEDRAFVLGYLAELETGR
jgi:predicted Zn-dependent protease